jgi:predicted GNAT family acetyltransferase
MRTSHCSSTGTQPSARRPRCIAPGAADAVERILRTGRAWLWSVDGRAVSLAARRAPEAGSARIGPVYTPPAERGHGYGSAVTAAASREIVDLGATPVLFTDLANPTSNRIYQALGYRRVEDRALRIFE